MNPTNNIAIQLVGVGKKYEIHHEKPTLAETLVKSANGRRNETFWALKNINLTIYKGENIGIIGPNGGGKTTLLKIITGITTPTTGTIHTKGSIISLIDLEAGFQPDLTGYQNIYLNGMLIGMSKQEIYKKIEAIVKFADIKQFIDAPLFTYSTGMKLRLGFSIAIHADPDILLVDEGFAVADKNFQKKSQTKFQEFKKNKTIIFVSHWLDFIKNNCSRILLIQNGNIALEGNASIITKYLARN